MKGCGRVETRNANEAEFDMKPCCKLDTDGDGNCPIHKSKGVMRKNPIDVHPETKAWREWLESIPACGNAKSLGASETADFYLRNRLHLAFDAGIEAAKKLGLQKVK